MRSHDHPPQDDDAGEFGPSRSQQRRDALALLALGEQLVGMPDARLERMQLPDDVLAEIANVRRIKAHGARKRQLAYLAKLMRRHGEDAFAGARAALGDDRERQRRDAAATQRLEALRERLLDDEDAAFAELVEQHPDLDRQHLRALLRRARAERDGQRPPRAYREVFRVLRALHERDAADTGDDA